MPLLPVTALLIACVLTSPVCAVAQAAAVPAVPPAPVEVVKLEQALWTAMAEGGFAAVRSLLTPDFIEVDGQIRAADALLVNLKHCKLESYELRDLQVRITSANSAMTAYHVVSSFNCGTEEKPETKSRDEDAMTVWVRRDGAAKWLAQAHMVTPAVP